jgi:PAS domain S-box-containing protein
MTEDRPGAQMTEEHQDHLLTQSLLLDEIGQSVIGMDSSWRVTYWNRASERLYGYAASEVLGLTPLELGIVGNFKTLAPGPTGEEIAERIARGKDWSGEFWVQDRAGREFPVHGTISPIRGRHTVPVDIVAISKDITDRKHQEAILRRLSAMVESSGDAIISADMDGRISSWNAGAVRMLGWSAGEAVGQNPGLFTTRAPEDVGERVAERIRSGAFVTGL